MSGSSSPGSSGGDYTPSQERDAAAVCRISCLYTVLGVEKTCTSSELKRAYKRRAMSFHPDKNRAPSAEEAFKLVSSAFQTLNDSEKRAFYDRNGTIDPHATDHQQRHQRGSAGFSQGFSQGHGGMHGGGFAHEDLTPEELFSFLFTGVPPGARRRHQAAHFARAGPFGGHAHSHGAGMRGQSVSFSMGSLIQLLVFVLPMLLMLAPRLVPQGGGAHSDAFSLDRSGAFAHKRSTENLGVEFFVNNQFSYKYRTKHDVRLVEDLVERAAFEALRAGCRTEQKARTRAIRDASREDAEPARRKKVFHDAYEMPRPSCDRVDQLMANAKWAQSAASAA